MAPTSRVQAAALWGAVVLLHWAAAVTGMPAHHRSWRLPFNSTDAAGTSVGVGAAGAAELLLFALGKTDNATKRDVAVYAPGNGTWSRLRGVLAEARAQTAATGGTRYALFAGGEDASASGQSAVVDVFDAATGEWSAARLSQARSFLGAATVRDARGRA